MNPLTATYMKTREGHRYLHLGDKQITFIFGWYGRPSFTFILNRSN